MKVFRNSVWEQSDTNFDGMMSPEELQSSSSKLPGCFAQHLIDWDQDQNGLSLKEMDEGLEVKDMVDKEAEKTFAVADLDCDGSLSLSSKSLSIKFTISYTSILLIL